MDDSELERRLSLALAPRDEVLEAYLFGSRASGRAPPLLYHRVLRDGRRILSRDLRATTTREGYALSRYCDFVPQLAKMAAARRNAAIR